MANPPPPGPTFPAMHLRAGYEDGNPLTEAQLDAVGSYVVTQDGSGNTEELTSVQIGPNAWITADGGGNFWITNNAYLYSGSWYLSDVTKPGLAVCVTGTSWTLYTAPAASGAIAWQPAASISGTGYQVASTTQRGTVRIGAGISIDGQGNISVEYGTASGTAAEGNDSRITGAEQTANKGVAGGYAELDGMGKVPVAEIPSSLFPATPLSPKGTWDASANSPALASGVGTVGDAYWVQVAGTTTLDGVSSWSIGDWAFFGSDNHWHRQLAAANAVPSVATVAALRAATVPSDGAYVLVLNNAATGDGFGGIYRYNASGTETDDGLWVIQPTSGGGDYTRVDRNANPAPGLPNWWQGGVAGKKIGIIGDSTSANSVVPALYSRLGTYTSAYGPLSGCSVVQLGTPGATAAQFLANTVSGGIGLSYCLGQGLDVAVISLGINDINNGTATQAQLVAIMTAIVQAFRTVSGKKPSVVLRMPNMQGCTFQTYANGQAKTTALQGAYVELANIWPDVQMLDTRPIFGTTSLASSPLLNSGADDLHPSTIGADCIADALVNLIAPPVSTKRLALAESLAAITQNPSAPWAFNPDIFRDNQIFELVAEGYLGTCTANGGNLGFFTLAPNKGLLAGDFVVIGEPGPQGQATMSVWNLPSGFTATDTAGGMLISGLGGSLPPTTITGGYGTPLRFYRARYGDASNCYDFTNVQYYLDRTGYYLYRRRVYITGGTNSISLTSAEDTVPTLNLEIGPNALLLVSGQSPITLGAYAASTSNGQSFTPTGSFSALTGRIGWVVDKAPGTDGNGATRVMEEAGAPVTFAQDGSIASGTYYRLAARTCKFMKFRGFLGTAGSTTTTVTISRTNASGSNSGSAVLTFAASARSPSVSYTAAVQVCEGDGVKFVVSAGTAAADLSVVCDI